MAVHVELRVLNYQPGCVCFQYSLRHPAAMNQLRAALALCLLGLWAASLAEETAQTEQVDDDHGLERQARELNEDVDVEADSYEDVMSRQKRYGECSLNIRLRRFSISSSSLCMLYLNVLLRLCRHAGTHARTHAHTHAHMLVGRNMTAVR